MTIAIATDGQYVSTHFGRCQAYTLVDIEDGQIVKSTQVANPGHAPGAIPAFLNGKGANGIVCGGIGARAIGLFEQYGIEIIAGIDGTIKSVTEQLKHGTLVGGVSRCKPGDGRGYGIEKTECDHTDQE